jgi:hypothetical protein
MEWIELPDSGRATYGDRPSIEIKLRVWYTPSRAVARAFALTQLPAWADGKIYQGLELTPIDDGTIWDVTATYGVIETQATREDKPEAIDNTPENQPPQQTSTEQESPIQANNFTFDLSGASQHIIRSIKTVRKWPANAPDYRNAIGVKPGDKGDEIEGIDVEVAQLQFTLDSEVPTSTVTGSWLRKLAKAYNAVNSEKFRGFEPGEVQFKGLTGARQGRDKMQLTGRFAVSLNSADVKIGNLQNNVNPFPKDGWDYLWIAYETVKDGGKLIQAPVAAYVEQIFERMDFKDIGFKP